MDSIYAVSEQIVDNTPPKTKPREKMDAEELERARASGRQQAVADRIEIRAQQAKYFFNTSFNPTPKAKRLIESVAPSINERKLIIHLAGSQKDDQNNWVPIGSNFLKKFKLGKIGDFERLVANGVLEKIEHANRGRYRRGTCTKWRFAPEFYKRLCAFGRIDPERAQSAINGLLQGRDPNQDGLEDFVWSPEWNRFEQTLGDGTRYIQYQNPILLNMRELQLTYAADRCMLELLKSQGASHKEIASLTQRLNQAARCIRKIAVEGKAKRGGMYEYYPLLHQHHGGERCYEGNGYQSLPKEYKAAAL